MIVGIFGVPAPLLEGVRTKLGTERGRRTVVLPRHSDSSGRLEPLGKYGVKCLLKLVEEVDRVDAKDRKSVGVIAFGADLSSELNTLMAPYVPVAEASSYRGAFARPDEFSSGPAVGRALNETVDSIRSGVRRLELYLASIVEYVRRETESALCLPLANFEDELLRVRLKELCLLPDFQSTDDGFDEGHFKQTISDQAEHLIELYCGKIAKQDKRFYKRRLGGRLKGCFERKRDQFVFVTPGNDLHGGPKEDDANERSDGSYLSDMKRMGHDDLCRLSCAYRLGRRLVAGYHYDCQFLPNRCFKLGFHHCHGSETEIPASAYVNIYPNDSVREWKGDE